LKKKRWPALELARKIAQLAEEKKARQLVALHVEELVSYTQIIVIMTATSDRHARALADFIQEELKKDKERPLGAEGYGSGKWILLDYGDVVVHVMQKEAREYYDLDGLWGEAPPLEL
jgi:ribosome-associated protein